jgi:hypothetical protein
MNREEALKELQKCIDNDDVESAHARADNVLCELLIALGYEDVVNEYHLVRKWYA